MRQSAFNENGAAPPWRQLRTQANLRADRTVQPSRTSRSMRSSSPRLSESTNDEEPMTFEDWIFSLHLLFAATLVGSLVMSWIVVVSMHTADTPAGR